jgi:NAD(P)-dependent dehydrogenase (short-subunit alcohol dehydrogenase family)
MADTCTGKIALVTGASRGIGAAIAERLAAEGADVVVCARSLDTAPAHLGGTLQDTVRRIESHGRRGVAIEADLTDPGARAALVPRARAALGDIDILVNNAAAAFYMPFEKYSHRRYAVAFELNVHAPFEIAQHVLPAMRERRRGWILNISSATARLPKGPPFSDFDIGGGPLLYGMTKAALERFSAGLAAETYADGIAVNALSPIAAVMTPGVAALGIVQPDQAELLEPMEVMVEAALALCTCDPRRVTGRIAYSKTLLRELGVEARGLDGQPLPASGGDA